VSWQTNAVRYVSVGETSARFRDLTLDYSLDGVPVEHVVWLKNGGGKSSMESLRSAVILPRAKDFTGAGREDGEKKPRTLEDYVGTGDTSHTVLLWSADNAQSLYGERMHLLTGAVYEWPDRRRPATTNEDKRLSKWWWSAVPIPGVLDLATLPVRDGRLLTGAQFIDRLRQFGTVHPELQVQISTKIGDWEEQLARLNVDAALYRYQARMNSSEGGIAKIFAFNKVPDFIDLVIDMVANPRQPQECSAILVEHAKNLFRRPALVTEQAFLGEASLVLTELARAERSVQTAAAGLAGAREQAGVLAARLRRAASFRASQAQVAAGRVEVLAGKVTDLNTKRRSFDRHRSELLRLAALDRLEAAKGETEAAHGRTEAARLEVAVWLAAGHLVEAQTHAAAAEEVTEQLKPERAEREALRTRRDAAAQATRSLLADAAAAATAQASEARSHAKTERALAKAAREEAAQHRRNSTEATRDAATAQAAVRQFDLALERAHSTGLLLPDEEPVAAAARLSGEAESTQAAAAAAKAEAEEFGRQAKQAAADARAATSEQARAEQVAEQARKREHALQERHAALATHPRLIALAEADERVDVWGDAVRLEGALLEAARDADARALAESVETAEDERQLAAISDEGLLPASTALLSAVAVLKPAGVTAQPVWTYLRSGGQPVLASLAAQRPDLVSAIVVQDDAARERAVSLLEAFPSLSLIPLVTADEVDRASEGVRTGTSDGAPFPHVPLHAGLHDPVAGDAAARDLRSLSEQRGARRATLTEQATLDRSLLAELAQFRADDPHPSALTDAQDLVVSTAKAAQDAADRVLAENQRAEGLQGQEREANERRAQLLVRAEELRRDARTASELATSAAGVAEQRELARLASELADTEQRQAEERDRLAVEHDAAAQTYERAADTADRAAADALTERDQTVLVGGDAAEPDAALLAQGLDACRVRYQRLRDEWQAASSASALEATLRGIQDRIADARKRAAAVVAEFPGDRAEVQSRSEQAALEPQVTSDVCQQRCAQARRSVEECVVVEAQAEAVVKTCEEKVRQTAPPTDRRRHTDQPVDYTGPDDAEREAERLAAESTALSEEETRLGNERDAQIKAADRLAADSEALNDIVRAIPADISSPTGTVPPFQGELGEARDLVEATMTRLTSAMKEHDKAVNDRASWTSEGLRVAGKPVYADLQLRILDRLRDGDAEAIGARAESFVTEIGHRVTALEAMLAQVEADEQRVTTVVAGHVRQLLNGIAGAARASRLPDGLNEISGRQFITITFADPTPDELIGRVSQEISRMLLQANGEVKALPSPEALLRRSVHAAVGAKGFKATVLKPNEHMIAHQVDITQVSAFSDGEKLTTCVLLFCAFARMRQRGSAVGGATGTLMLDNPFGKASAAELVQLQLAVAAVQRVHLVYYTGLQDMGALVQFRGITRLVNRTTLGGTDGHVRKLEDVSAGKGEVSGVSVTRPDAPVPPGLLTVDQVPDDVSSLT
jgi:hypothetical protein